MQKTCKNCSQNFKITCPNDSVGRADKDLKFYEKVSPKFNNKKYLIPPPYSPDRSEIVYCEKCYLALIY